MLRKILLRPRFPSPRQTWDRARAARLMDIPSALQALKQGSALLSQPERRALAAVLRTLADELSTDSDVAALTTGVALASIGEPPWQLPQPHSEAMPWKLLLCQWWLLGPEDQLRLRAVCSGLHVGELASHFVAQHPGMMYTHLLAGSVDEGDSVDAPAAFRCARAVCAELRFIRNLQLRCAEAEARELAVHELVQGGARPSSGHAGYNGQVHANAEAKRAVRELLLPGDPRVVHAARSLAKQSPGYCAATVAGSFALHRLLAQVPPWPRELDIVRLRSAPYLSLPPPESVRGDPTCMRVYIHGQRCSRSASSTAAWTRG